MIYSFYYSGPQTLDPINEASEPLKTQGPEQKKASINDLDEDENDGNSSRYSAYSGTIPASSIYEIINKAVNKEKMTISWPKTFRKRLQYIFLIPLTHS